MSVVTRNVSEYVRKKGINLSELSRSTKIQYRAIYDSLAKPERDRDLRDHELIKICTFLGVDPMDFADKKKRRRQNLDNKHRKKNIPGNKKRRELENQRKDLKKKARKRNREVKSVCVARRIQARSNKEWTKIYIDKKPKK